MKGNIVIVCVGGLSLEHQSFINKIAEENFIAFENMKEFEQQKAFEPEPIIIKPLEMMPDYGVYPITENRNKFFDKPKNNYRK